VELEYEVASGSAVLGEGVTRVSAELRLAGFDVRLVEAPSDAIHGYARVRLSEAAGKLSVEIVSHTSETESRLLTVATEREIRATAVQVAEFLRAGLVPRATVRAAPLHNAEPAPQPAPVNARPALKRSLRVQLGAAVLSNWNAGDLLPLLEIGAGFALSRRAWLTADLHLPLADAHYEASRGSAAYHSWFATLGADSALLSWSAGALSVGVRAGAARVSSAGAPSAPLEGRHASTWALALAAHVEVEQRIVEPLALTAGVAFLTLSPGPVVAVLDDERRLARPALIGAVGARVFLR